MKSGMRFSEEEYQRLISRSPSAPTVPEPAPAAKRVVPTAPAASGKTHYQALGRLADGEKNPTEQRFEDEYLRPRLLAREFLWYEFELIKVKLAKNTHITIDFFAMRDTRELIAIDVKGSRKVVSDDSLAKTKVAASLCPWDFYFAFPRKGGGWDIQRVEG